MTARFDLRERLEPLSREYRNSGRKGKGALLDEWSRRTGYQRKHLAWILSKELYRRPAKGRSGRRRRYSEGALFVLVRLKAMLPHLLSSASAETLPGYTPAIGAELLAMSPRTMDYRLSAHAGKYARRAPAPRLRRACAASRTVRSGIPVSTHRPFDAPVGTLEVDTGWWSYPGFITRGRTPHYRLKCLVSRCSRRSQRMRSASTMARYIRAARR